MAVLWQIKIISLNKRQTCPIVFKDGLFSCKKRPAVKQPLRVAAECDSEGRASFLFYSTSVRMLSLRISLGQSCSISMVVIM